MIHKSDADWEKWGSADPYFGVLTHEKFRNAQIGANRDEFFATGRDFVREILARYTDCFGEIGSGSALDFGCGVGRLTMALAEHFDRVRGVDISPSMLVEAERNAAMAGKSGQVTFGLSDDALTNAPGTYDMVFSFIVLQHVPVERGMVLIDELMARVRPGGAFFLHVSTWPSPSTSRRLAARVKQSRTAMALFNLIRGRPLSHPTMLMGNYPLSSVLNLLYRAGAKDVLTLPDMHEDVFTVGLLGRRSGHD